MKPLVTAITVFAGLVFTGLGIWAFAAPESFYSTVATYPPFNLHLFHDAGAFQIGIGAALLAAVVMADGFAAVLAGATVGAVVHAVAHFMDQDLGGRTSDPWALAGFAVLLAAGLALRLRAVRRT